MKIDTHLLTLYIDEQKKPEANTWFYQFTNGTSDISDHRQDVCLALLQECDRYQQFPLWNKQLATLLFPDIEERLNSIILLPVIGSHKNFDAQLIQYQGIQYLLVDLLNIADYTQSLKEMSYILHNLCHIALYEYLFTSYQQATNYIEHLKMRFFVNGWVQYLSWNEHHEQYVFHNPGYQQKKKRAFTLLATALAVNLEDQTTQKQILRQLSQVDLWNRFPDIAGLFYLDEIFHTQGDQGLLTYFQEGPNQLFDRII